MVKILIWTAEDFMKTLRTGDTPRGKGLVAERMSWKIYRQMADRKRQAMYTCLDSLPDQGSE